jgi:hypothetical protein
MEAIADLLNHPGYPLLLEHVQRDIDDISDQIESSGSHETDRDLLGQWKAMRKVLRTLKETPIIMISAAEDQRKIEEGTFESLGMSDYSTMNYRQGLISEFPTSGNIELEEDI